MLLATSVQNPTDRAIESNCVTGREADRESTGAGENSSGDPVERHQCDRHGQKNTNASERRQNTVAENRLPRWMIQPRVQHLSPYVSGKFCAPNRFGVHHDGVRNEAKLQTGFVQRAHKSRILKKSICDHSSDSAADRTKSARSANEPPHAIPE